jgi:hypothetical protein
MSKGSINKKGKSDALKRHKENEEEEEQQQPQGKIPLDRLRRETKNHTKMYPMTIYYAKT